MKIIDSIPMSRGESRVLTNDRSGATATAFQKMLNTYSKELSHDHINKLLQDIDQQGQQLQDSRTFQELKKYKFLVKQFIDEVSKNGIRLEQGQSWDSYSGHKTLKTIKILDQKLLDLTKHVLDQQSDGISLLDRIGEIKGLLINLYT